jgi:peptidoglycan LD-endopeptidase LytH
MRVFPVADVPGVHFTDDFHAVEDESGRRHLGIDIFAPEGTPTLAPENGSVRFEVDPIGGLSWYVKGDDGVTYYGTHLSDVEGGPRRVEAGEVIGYVGHDGNARGTPDHLHFEIHPPGQTVDPFSLLRSAPRRDAPSRMASSLLLVGLVGAAGYGMYRAFGSPVPQLTRLARLLPR